VKESSIVPFKQTTSLEKIVARVTDDLWNDKTKQMNYNDFVNTMQGEKYLYAIGEDLRRQVREDRIDIECRVFCIRILFLSWL